MVSQSKYLRCVAAMTALVGVQAPAQPYVVDTLVTNPATSAPTCMTFIPGGSGDFFYTEFTTGSVRVYENGVLRPAPFTTVPVTSRGEQGLLGITLHPSYPDSPYVYIYYTRAGDRANMVVRYRDAGGTGADPETLLIVPRTDGATNHNGGNIHFGPDGKLFVTIGDYGATAGNAQDTSAANPRGKILRLNPDGSIPPDNPFPGKPFWSIGHRNSFDFTFDDLTGIMYSTENGPNCNDEVNLVPRGGNMGWPNDGFCTYTGNPLYVRPLYYFPSNLPALTGIAVYRGTAFPRLSGSLVIAGNSNPRLWTLRLTSAGDTVVPGSFSTFFAWSTGFADLEVGPDGFLYITNGPYQSHKILRLRPVAPVFTSSAPTTAQPDEEYVYTPTFSGTPPGLQILEGPAGMSVDTSTWSVRWTPSPGQAGRVLQVRLLAENGAGSVEESWLVTTGTTVVREATVPLEFALLPNHPNPFNPSTILTYRIPEEGRVRVSVVDLLGRTVAVLADRTHEPGEYTVMFPAEGLSSGVYLGRLEAGDLSLTRRMVLVR